VTGYFGGTVDFGCGPLTSTGDWDIFIVKSDPNGNCAWSQSFGDSETQRGLSIAVDALGNVLGTGYFAGTVDFGGGPLTGGGGRDIFLAKFGPSSVGISNGTPSTTVRLWQNHPNPFNPQTMIRYFLPTRTTVSLGVFDLAGRVVRELRSGEMEGPGQFAIEWDGTDQRSQAVGSGTYIYRLEAGNFKEARRMVIIR
jgi:hypothetical protein